MAPWTNRRDSLAAWAALVAVLLAGVGVWVVYPKLFYVPRELAPDYKQPDTRGQVCRAWYREAVASSLGWKGAEFDVVLTRPLAWLPWLERVDDRVTLPEAKFLTSAGAACALAQEIFARKEAG